MKHKITRINLQTFKDYYNSIQGGIDGYYEKTIVNSNHYVLMCEDIIGYFTVHTERGLTSLIVLDEFIGLYEEIFRYVTSLDIVDKILFTENDELFLKYIQKYNFDYEIQAYNFEVNKKITSHFQMDKVDNAIIEEVLLLFGEFIQYNNMDLKQIDSFHYKEDNDVISFGALEPMLLNENRYCISMIVNEKYRQLGYGSKTIQFLINYLQSNNKEVNARCYVKNEVSKRTLLKSGMTISNHLFKCENILK